MARRRPGACRVAMLGAAALLLWATLHHGAPRTARHPQAHPQPHSTPPRWVLDAQAPSSAHGWVAKAGPAAVGVWHRSADAQRRASWDRFLASRAAGETPLDQSYPGVPPHGPDAWGCRLYFNRAYKLFFVRTAKTGSTTVLERVLPACVKAPGVPHCLERVADGAMSAEEVAHLWRTFTAFTFTRNVWGRAVSQYQYLVHFVRNNGTGGGGAGGLRCARVLWGDFCRDPLALGALCRAQPRCCTKKWTHQDWHMRQQTACFLTADDPPRWAVDFIGRLEHFDEDMAELFAVVNSKRSPGLPALHYEPQPPANIGPSRCSDEARGGSADAAAAAAEAGEGGGRRFAVEARPAPARRRRGLFAEGDPGTQLSDVNYCAKPLWFTGRYARCFTSLTRFFAADVALLHANLTAGGAAGAGG